MQIEPIAHIYNAFPEKFGLPRQSGMAEHLLSEIVMEEKYRVMDAFRGIQEFSHLWLLWEFDPLTDSQAFSPTVRPPKLGGNERVGVFATRSPNRPNRIGMTLVKLIDLKEEEGKGPVLTVAGADIRSGTAIFDIKPYVEYADHPENALSGFADRFSEVRTAVVFECEWPSDVTPDDRLALEEVLSLDPRPGYQHDDKRVYQMAYRDHQVGFVSDGQMIRVISIQ